MINTPPSAISPHHPGLGVSAQTTNSRRGDFRPIIRLALWLGILVIGASEGLAQGCIAIRNNPGTPLMEGDFSNNIETGTWVNSLAYRWFASNRHYKGDVEQTERQRLGNYVENKVHSADFSATYGVSSRWSVTLDIPYIYADRSSLYEHDLIHRNVMHSQGFGDVRVLADYWLLDPHEHKDGNLAFGVGVKLPTGDDKASALAYRSTGPVYRPVDPSIQPGDGGWGIIFQVQGYHKVVEQLFAYLDASYMITPQEQNSTELTIADVPAFAAFITDQIRHNTIADQYSARAGLSYEVSSAPGLNLSLGGRLEGVPATDLVGGSMGFRRPGYTVSVEPGVSWSFKKNTVSLNVPIAEYRNRVRSAPEKALGRPGGDAAFADYSILLSFTHAY
jgi:hypothetical protein